MASTGQTTGSRSSASTASAPSGVTFAVTGPLSRADLGRTLVHERLVTGLAAHRFVHGRGIDDAVVAAVEARLSALSDAGVDTIVDSTPLGFDRAPELLEALAQDASVRVLCTTGFDGSGVPPEVDELPAERLADHLVRELQEGIAGTGIRAAALTLATSADDALAAARLLAVSFAHAETGRPVIVTDRGETAVRRLDLLIGRGVDPDRVLVANLDDAQGSFRAVDEVARRGALLGFTGVGGDAGLSEDARAALVAYAVRSYGPERICVSLGGSLASAGGSDDESATSRPARLAGFLDRLETYGVTGARGGDLLSLGAAELLFG